MRIGIFTDFSLPHIGGVETSVFHQHRALSAAGHTVFILSPPQKGADKISDEVEGVIRLRSPIPIYFDGMGIYYWSPRVFKKIDKLKLDVVHVESEYNVGALGVRYAKKRKLPLFYTAHTFYPPQIELFMSMPKTMAILATIGQRLMLRGYRPKKKFKAHDGYLGIPARTFAQRRILDVWMKFVATTDVVLAPSQRMKQYVEYYVKTKPVYYIPNPFNSLITDTETYAEAVHNPIRLLTTSVMRPEKRPDILIRAVAALTPEERSKITLDMYGGGKMLKELKRFIKKEGLSEFVHLHGSVDNRVIQKALMDGDVAISLSVGFDNQPMVILEAIHCGNAVLYCDKYLTEGTHGANAILADETVEGLTEKLREIVRDPEGVAVLKRNSKELAKQYTYEAYVDNYNSILINHVNK